MDMSLQNIGLIVVKKIDEMTKENFFLRIFKSRLKKEGGTKREKGL